MGCGKSKLADSTAISSAPPLLDKKNNPFAATSTSDKGKRSATDDAKVGDSDVVVNIVIDDDDRAVDNLRVESKIEIALAAKRRGDIFNGSINVDRTSSVPRMNSTRKSNKTRSFLKDALKNNILFRDLDDDEMSAVLSALNKKTIAAGTTVIRQGDKGDLFYVVEQGSFSFVVDGENKGGCGRGDLFGELALLYNCPRAADVKLSGSEDGVVWVLERGTFRSIMANKEASKKNEVKKALRSVNLFSGLNTEQINKISDAMGPCHFNAGETIIRKGDAGNLFFIIKKGKVKCTQAGGSESDKKPLADHGSVREHQTYIELENGAYFGERSLLTSEPRAANVIAISDTDCLVLDREDFHRLLGPLRDVLDANLSMNVLGNVALLAELSQTELHKLQNALKEEPFKEGTTIVKQGDRGSKFYLIKEGRARVKKIIDHGPGATQEPTKVVVADLSMGDYFGEGALLKDEPRSANVEAITDVVCLTLERAAFEKLLGPLAKLMKRALDERENETDDILREETRVLEASIKLKDLKMLNTLGTGTFGRVKLVQCPKFNKTYALKILQKAQVVKYHQQKNVMNEKELLLECNHPFILKLHNTFKDKHALYLLLELVLGGELFSLLHIRGGTLNNGEARFYAACVVDALEYMHMRTIVYRDLKPENLMIDAKGYVKVVDFGFAKKIIDKTYTLCGTPDYLCPEIVLGKGHNKAVDNWAIGILIYELLTGASPFADQMANDHMTICKNIVRCKIIFPRKFPNEAKDLVSKLVVSNAHMRLGSLRNGTSEIKEHGWFRIDWRDLYRCKIKAPWIPALKDNLDTSNFDDYPEDDYIEKYKPFDNQNWDKDF